MLACCNFVCLVVSVLKYTNKVSVFKRAHTFSLYHATEEDSCIVVEVSGFPNHPWPVNSDLINQS